MSTTPTPRTDADKRQQYLAGYTHPSGWEFARQLERELAEAKETIETMEMRHAATMLHGQTVVDEANKLRAENERLRNTLNSIRKTANHAITPQSTEKE